jgi:uncharacterized protein
MPLDKPVKIYRDKNSMVNLPPRPVALMDEFNKRVPREMNDSATSPLEKLAFCYDFIQRYNTQYVSTIAVCHKGCTYCCTMDVQISLLEAVYIQEQTHGHFRMREGKNLTTGHKTACPFLSDDGSCGIYSIRPFNCRTFHTLDDPKYCATTESHQTYGAAGYGYGVDVYAAFADWLRHVNQSVNGPYRDIRDWFALT